ncbi:hypothetical protein ALQ20_200044 [Pseudomonas syringae pv. atrofaciens]|nr:hypothetical protein ALQ20_200044 [Pseudomonas syringae pv. atrofaciens]
MNALQVNRQLTHGLDQQLLGLDRMADTVLLDRQRQLLDFLGQQRGAVELDHLQTAVNLMHQVQALGHRSSIGRVFDEQVQRLTGLAQRFGDLALQPLKSNVIVTISHDEYRPLPNQGCSCAVHHPAFFDDGRAKPDTERRISLAIFARLPMLSAVAEVPEVVCEVVC